MDLLNVIHDSFVTRDISLKTVAPVVHKTYPKLSRELNPNDPLAKLGASTLFDLMKHTKNVTPLRYMAEQLGYKLTPIVR